MKLIIGLGNPGKQYENTRHNIGFRVVSRLADELGLDAFSLKSRFESLITEGAYMGEKIVIALPQIFMNNSGKAATALKNFYKCPLEDLFLVYDDVDLPFGMLRFRPEGSAGTHNGMRSVVESLGCENFPRLRIGIENRNDELKKKQDIADYVLSAFTAKEEEELPEILKQAAEKLKLLIEGGK